MRKEELFSSEDVAPEGEYKIALGYDPDDDPSPLFDYTFHLAALLKGKVVIVHALEGLVSTKTEEEERKIKEQIVKIVENLKEAQSVPFSVEILYGKDIENFIQFVEKDRIDLFGFYYYKKLLGKSLSQLFLEKLTNCGLLVVKEKQEFRPIRKVLIPLDFSESSFKQKEFVLRLKQFSPQEVEVVFLHVMEEEDKTQKEEVFLLFRELFDEGIGTLRIESGEPEEVILQLLEKEEYNLVVIGRTGKGLNLECGKVTCEVVKEAPCPVVVV